MSLIYDEICLTRGCRWWSTKHKISEVMKSWLSLSLVFLSFRYLFWVKYKTLGFLKWRISLRQPVIYKKSFLFQSCLLSCSVGSSCNVLRLRLSDSWRLASLMHFSTSIINYYTTFFCIIYNLQVIPLFFVPL